MKRVKLIVFFLFIASFNYSYTQLWKQYADSAKAFNGQKRMDLAISYYSKAKDELRKDSLLTLSYSRLCNALGSLHSDKGEYQKAEQYYFECRGVLEKVIGKEQPEYAGICFNLGNLYINMAQFQKAESFYSESRRIREKSPGKGHADYAISCNSLANSYCYMGQFEKAEPLYLEALQIREKLFGKENADYAATSYNLSAAYMHLGKYEIAKPMLIEARDIRGRVLGKEHPEYAAACNNLGLLYFQMGQYDKVEAFYLETMQIREKLYGKNHPEYIASCLNLATIYSYLVRFEESEKFFKEGKEITEKVLGKNHPHYAGICLNLATLYMKLAQYPKAEPLLIEAKKILEAIVGKDHADYAMCCDNLAFLYKTIGRYVEAEPLFIEARQINRKLLGNEHPFYASGCNNLAALYEDLDDYEKADSLYTEAKLIREKTLGKQHPDYAGSLDNLAGLYKKMGQYAKAETHYIEAKKIRSNALSKDDPDYSTSCNNLAVLYQEMGRYEKAELLFIESREIRRRILGEKHHDYAETCNNLALLYYLMGQYEKSETLYMEARQLFADVLGKNHPEYAACCNNLAILYLDMKEYGKAEPLYLEAKKIREDLFGKEHSLYAESCSNLAILYITQAKFEKAEPLCIEAKRTLENVFGKENARYATACNILALLYDHMRLYEKAEPLYLEAREIRKKTLGIEHPDYTETCINLGELYWNQKKPAMAKNFFSEVYRSQSIQVSNIFQFTNEAEQQSYLKKIAWRDKEILSFHTSVYPHSQQGFAYNISLSSRNLILSSLQQLSNVIYNTADTSVKNKYNSWIYLKEQISLWHTRPINERPSYVKGLEERAGILEKELSRYSSEITKKQGQDITWQTIKKTLLATEAVIEFVELEYYDGGRWTDSIYYLALICRKDKTEPELIHLFEKKQLENILTRSGQLSEGGKYFTDSVYLMSPLKSNHSAYSLIWQPIEKSLRGITKIYFAPSGLLHRISFAALPVVEGKVLSDKYQLVRLNTTASVVGLPRTSLSTTDRVILYGGVKYDADSSSLKTANQLYAANGTTAVTLHHNVGRGDRGNSWEYLPASLEEINEIERVGKQKKFLLTLYDNVGASEESIKSLNAKNSPSVLHIATHGFFFPDPKENKKDDLLTKFEKSGKVFRQSDNPLFRSGLLFAGANNAWKGKPVEGIEDGILTAYEVSNLYLPNTKLVVLSACETGLGDIQGSEGVYGLQRSFKMAGVQNLVMSLWKVPDEATSEFMQLFYQNMFNKQSISAAFYHAQAAMKNKYRNNPYNWAAWVLVR